MQAREIWSGLPRGQRPALCFGPVGQAGLHLTLGLPRGPGQSTSEPSPLRRVLSLCSKPPPHLCLAGPPVMGTWVPGPWAEPPASTMRDPWPIPAPRPECLDAPAPTQHGSHTLVSGPFRGCPLWTCRISMNIVFCKHFVTIWVS